MMVHFYYELIHNNLEYHVTPIRDLKEQEDYFMCKENKMFLFGRESYIIRVVCQNYLPLIRIDALFLKFVFE